MIGFLHDKDHFVAGQTELDQHPQASHQGHQLRCMPLEADGYTVTDPACAGNLHRFSNVKGQLLWWRQIQCGLAVMESDGNGWMPLSEPPQYVHLLRVILQRQWMVLWSRQIDLNHLLRGVG